MLKYLFQLKNQIQHYDWGSQTAFKTLFGINNTTQLPQAEMWMGAHPNGTSLIEVDGHCCSLAEFIQTDPAAILSSPIAEQNVQLPFLFKILAADRPLSIQVHPNKNQAEHGFTREQAAGIAVDACNRNYHDSNHKPELIYALTPFKAMHGFRPFTETLALFEQFNSSSSLPVLHHLYQNFNDNLTCNGLQNLFYGLLSMSGDEKRQAINHLLNIAKKLRRPELTSDPWQLICNLAKQHPEDAGVFSPLVLNIVNLKPGQSMYLDACTPHAYVNGTGLEVMANSDNVLRAGLTAKHIDLAEVVRCTEFIDKPVESLLLSPIDEGWCQHYIIPVKDFKFSCYQKPNKQYLPVNSAEIILAIDSEMWLEHDSGEELILKKGESVFVPAYANGYQISSRGQLARVYS